MLERRKPALSALAVLLVCTCITSCAARRAPDSSLTPIAFTERFIEDNRLGLNIATQMSEKRETAEGADFKEIYGLACLSASISGRAAASPQTAYSNYCSSRGGHMDGEYCVTSTGSLFRAVWSGHLGNANGNSCPGARDFHVWEPKSSTGQQALLNDYRSVAAQQSAAIATQQRQAEIIGTAAFTRAQAEFDRMQRGDKVCATAGAYGGAYVADVEDKDNLRYKLIIQGWSGNLDSSRRNFLVNQSVWEPAQNWRPCDWR